jgi:hypothetical protein
MRLRSFFGSNFHSDPIRLPIVGIFRQFKCSEKDDEAIERFRADKQKEDTTDRFQDAIHALYENADREKAMHMPSGHYAGHTSTAPRRPLLYARQTLRYFLTP